MTVPSVSGKSRNVKNRSSTAPISAAGCRGRSSIVFLRLLTLSEPCFTVREVFSTSDHTRTMSPSDAAWQQLISQLHASGRKAALAITGGGSGAVGELLRVPGGSRLLIEAQVPYDALALAAFLGFVPAQACSADIAIAMAQSARARAGRLVPAGTHLVGLGATAALVSDRPRRGEHRFHIAFANSAGPNSNGAP